MGEDRERDEVEREAADWLVRLNDRSVSTDTLDAFFNWRRVPEHGEAFSRIEYLWDRSEALAGDRDMAFAVKEALDRRTTAHAPSSWLATRRGVLAGGAGLALLGAVGGIAWLRHDLRYETGVGEQRTVELEDGSKIALNTDSAVGVYLSSSERRIRLDRGEAWFDVAHDAKRPFSVQAALAKVTAFGTSFSVRSRADSDRVVLAEGRVEVLAKTGGEARMLTPATLVEIRDGVIGKTMRADLVHELAWRTGHISFRDTPLGDAVSEINRYTRRRIALQAPRFAAVPVNGTFETGDVDTFVTGITTLFPLTAKPAGNGGLVVTER